MLSTLLQCCIVIAMQMKLTVVVVVACNRLLYQSSTCWLQFHKLFVREMLNQFYISLVLALHHKESRNILYVCCYDKHNLNRD